MKFFVSSHCRLPLRFQSQASSILAQSPGDLGRDRLTLSDAQPVPIESTRSGWMLLSGQMALYSHIAILAGLL